MKPRAKTFGTLCRFFLLNAVAAGITSSQEQQAANQPRLVAQVGHSREINAVALSPDGKYLLTGSKDDTVRL
jgi:WD40 repeat protein